jgi:hypothetical protein
MGRMDDAIEAWTRGSSGNSWGSFARGDQMLDATLLRGRVGTVIALLATAALVVILLVLFH